MPSVSFLKMGVRTPLVFVSSGQFASEEAWSHATRIINSFEVIIGVNKILYIKQEDTEYQVAPGEVLLLLPGRVHTGYRQCEPGVSFYWLHFKCAGHYELLPESELAEEIGRLTGSSAEPAKTESVYLPLYHRPDSLERVNILFHQMQHLAKSNSFIASGVHYLLTSLLIELSEQALSKFHSTANTDLDRRLVDILEWIRIHTSGPLTVSSVAHKFGYNKDYLSRFFKQKMGRTMQEFIHQQKLSKMKDFLSRTNLSIKEITYHVGMNDEKYLLRLFKKYERMTPTEFRRAYYLKHMNND
jgi:AraC-like DNA-binding protein